MVCPGEIDSLIHLRVFELKEKAQFKIKAHEKAKLVKRPLNANDSYYAFNFLRIKPFHLESSV